MKKSVISKILVYLCVIVIVLYVLLPFIFLVITSLKQERDVIVRSFTFFPPHGFDTLNWRYLFLGGSLPPEWGYQWSTPGVHIAVWSTIINSLIVAVSCVILNLVISGLGGYALARIKYIPGRNSAFMFLLATKMLPTAAIIIPLYLLLKQIGIINTLLALIIPYVAVQTPISIWILRGFFESLPPELEEAAWIDGASRMQTLLRIMLPIIVPGLGAVAVYSFLGAWGEFFFAVTFTSYPNTTFPVTISQFALEDNMVYSVLCTVGTFSVIPSIIIAILFQKLLIQGLTAGAVKR